MRARALAFLGLITILISTGCGRARVSTEIHADGSFTRSVALTGQEKQAEGGPQMTPSLDDVFIFPTAAGWRVADNKGEKGEITKTFTRKFLAGRTSKGDLSLREGKGSPKAQLVSEVSVKKVGPKRYEYRETITWVGTPPKPPEINAKDLAELKAALPKDLATDENARALSERTAVQLLPMLFGPNDPLLATGMIHPELAERRARQKIGSIVLKALEEQFGEKMTVEQRRSVASRLISGSFTAAKPSKPDPMEAGEKKDSAGLIALTFVLKAPGKLVSSNGDYDELSGEVFWALFPEAASVQPVVLTAVFEVQ